MQISEIKSDGWIAGVLYTYCSCVSWSMGRKSTPVLLIRECIWALLDSLCLRAIPSEPRWLDLLQTTLRVLWSQCWPCVTVCANNCSLVVHAAGAVSHMLPAEVVAPPSLASIDILEHVICYGIHGYLVVRMQMCPVRTPEAHYSTLFSPNQENPFCKDQQLHYFVAYIWAERSQLCCPVFLSVSSCCCWSREWGRGSHWLCLSCLGLFT